MLWNLAWRNIFRSRGKSYVSLLLLALSTFVLSTFIALITGTLYKIYDDAIDIFPGTIQISHPAYDDEPNYDNLMPKDPSLLEKLRKDPQIKAVSSRLQSFFLFSSHENSIGCLLTGIEPVTEMQSSKLHTTLTQGRFLKPDDTNSIVIGDELAKNLDLKVGDTLSIIGTGIDYSFAADNLTVIGLFHTAIPDMDTRFALINKPYLEELIGAQKFISRIIITPFNRKDSLKLAERLDAKFGTPTVKIVDWHIHLKALIDSVELIRISRYMLIYFFIAIIFAVITIFALLMLLARQKELGIMKALGTTPLQVVKILFIERFILTLIAISLGTLFSGLVSNYLELHPIAIKSADEMVQRIGAMEFIFKSYFSYGILAQGALTIFFFSFITIFYPTWRLSRQKPIDAINAL